jgi:hypothetical protein
VRARLRHAALLLVVASALAGCAAGRWIAGAPAPGEAPRAATPRAPHASRTSASLLVSRCANCHAVPDPHAMTADAWLASLDRMKLRMHLPDAEWDELAAMAKR